MSIRFYWNGKRKTSIMEGKSLLDRLHFITKNKLNNVSLSRYYREQISWGRVSRPQLYVIGQAIEENGVTKRDAIERNTYSQPHSQIGNTGLRCNLLYLGIEGLKGGSKSRPHQTTPLNQGGGFGCCLHYCAIQVGAIRNELFQGGGSLLSIPL